MSKICFTRLNKNKREWSDDALKVLINITSEIYEKKTLTLSFMMLSHVLHKAFKEAGFSLTSVDRNKQDITWDNEKNKWSCPVRLWKDDTEIFFSINGELQELRDILPLWGKLREQYENP